MKILLVHNFYGSSAPSGENTVYLAERDLLVSRGEEVLEFNRHSDEIRGQGAVGVLKGALATPWNPFSARAIRELIARERPEVVHVHNSFPLISPSVFSAARSMGCATVLTLHNYRTVCAAGIPERGGVPCTLCLEKRSSLPALARGCYRDSRVATVPMAANIELHRALGTWRKQVDAFIALTSFQRDMLSVAGLPKEKIHVKPHFYDNPPDPLPWSGREARVVFIGRLGQYKGVHVLIEAWNRWGAEAPRLEIIGEGPERKRLEEFAAWGAGKVTFSGHLPFEEAQKRLASSRLLVLPSLCFEGFPMVIREAFALGVPVAGSNLGSIPCIVEDETNGVLFTPGDPDDLLAKVRTAWEEPLLLEGFARRARRSFEEHYTADSNYRALQEIYRKALQQRRSS
ncbi:glycosyltransferase family 4 protein [Geomonas sp. Red32]|uniref:glycosyltransferase family 4 protein n=1 Tax=Geomonas sp. Red32 TaxID=2912856 RepID=UPI00202CF242|nr:glycosyltransferase family 4 protein [Geomonas sp. Red32]MCM0081382.1 glycosyltransferase family 4 protein [Geomonas sp. Red32]